ncbi:MAG: hypothetical protein LDL33_07025 [Desulfomonile sp.]|nr:hypothetical protein [Desulfomonile sp.]
MAGILVKTVEELAALCQTRSHPTIVIEGELANNLIISGLVCPRSDRSNGEGEVSQLKTVGSHLYPVCRILTELSRTNCFEILGADGPKRIKIYPRLSSRREGN